MAARVSSRRWLLRDIPQTYVVLVWVAFCLSLLFYFSDWSPFQREAAVRQQNVNNANAANIDKRYAGSIIVVVPERGGRCLERVFDNRTGQLRDRGFVNCNQATHTNQAGCTQIM